MGFEDIWNEYRSGLKAFLYSKVSNPADVDDLLQEIMIKTYRNLNTVKSESSMKSWIYQISNNVIIDHYRKSGRTYNENDLADFAVEDDSDEIQQALAKCIEPFIGALPKESADLLRAIEIEDQSQKDYANEQGINYSTVKSRVQKSRLQLRALFEECCQLSFDKQGHLVDFQSKSKSCDKC